MFRLKLGHPKKISGLLRLFFEVNQKNQIHIIILGQSILCLVLIIFQWFFLEL